jgi:5-methylcytosine-specific restriction endonuclease McrA
VQFAGSWGDRYGWCKGCYSQARRTGYAKAAELFAEEERAKGRDPELSRGYRFYSQDPDEVLRAPRRRRAARLRAAERDGYRRAAIFARDGWRCWLCGRALDEDTATIDHVVAIAVGGSDTAANVRAACGECNSRRGARAAHEFRPVPLIGPRDVEPTASGREIDV